MARATPVLVAAAVLGAISCTPAESGTGSGAAGFASHAGVLGCAEAVTWGTVVASQPVRDGLQVTVAVEEWVHPSTGSDSITFVADDPAQEVGAPAWEVSPTRMLVVLSDHAPPAPSSAEDGTRAVQEWRAADSPRPPQDECRQA